MPPYRVENWPIDRVATSPPIWASGLDWGECPVVRPWARRVSSSSCRPTPHCVVAIMSTGSIEVIAFIRDPSTTRLSSTTVSRPPSVAVRPVRGTTLTRFSSANRKMAATSAVEEG